MVMTLGRVTARREDETLAGLTLEERIPVSLPGQGCEHTGPFRRRTVMTRARRHSAVGGALDTRESLRPADLSRMRGGSDA